MGSGVGEVDPSGPAATSSLLEDLVEQFQFEEGQACGSASKKLRIREDDVNGKRGAIEGSDPIQENPVQLDRPVVLVLDEE
jgi:hypothetical protein